ncbi:MAG: hypothetical protein V1875_07355 [Candidatus Altiarchaeota archaeon]
MKIKFECQKCGFEVVIENPLTVKIPCSCGGEMVALTNAAQDSGEYTLANVNVPPASTLMGYALKLGSFNIGKKRRSEKDMGRPENMRFVREGIMRLAIATNTSDISIQSAIRYALRLDIKEDTAIDYVRMVEKAGYFPMKNGSFIVDLNKAKKELGIETKLDLIRELEKFKNG